MKTWIRRTLIAALGTSLLVGGIAAWAGYRHHGWQEMSAADIGQMKARMVDRVGSRLDLDAAQKAKLSNLADVMSAQRQTLMAGKTDPRTEFMSLMAGPSFDRTRASALIEAKVAAVQQGAPAMVNAAADFYDSLRPEQQLKAREFMAQRGHRHGDKDGKGHGRGEDHDRGDRGQRN